MKSNRQDHAPHPHPTELHLAFVEPVTTPEQRRVLCEGLGEFRHRPSGKLTAVLREIGYYDDARKNVLELMRSTKPRDTNPVLWSRIQAFVEDCIATTGPLNLHSAETARKDLAAYIQWATFEKHLPLDARILFEKQLIDMHIVDPRLDLAEGTRRNRRGHLERVRRALMADLDYEYTPLNRRETQAPYTGAEMLGFKEWARCQSSHEKIHKAKLLLSLCAGAGLNAGEVLLVRVEDVSITAHGIIIHVHGTVPRQVPVSEEYEQWLKNCVKFAEENYPGDPLWRHKGRKKEGNAISAFTNQSTGSVFPRADRLRHTWLVWHLNNRTPMKDLFFAGGFRKMEHLGRLIEHCDFMSGDNYLAVLSGRA